MEPDGPSIGGKAEGRGDSAGHATVVADANGGELTLIALAGDAVLLRPDGVEDEVNVIDSMFDQNRSLLRAKRGSRKSKKNRQEEPHRSIIRDRPDAFSVLG